MAAPNFGDVFAPSAGRVTTGARRNYGDAPSAHRAFEARRVFDWLFKDDKLAVVSVCNGRVSKKKAVEI